jgi:hypothetical protein
MPTTFLRTAAYALTLSALPPFAVTAVQAAAPTTLPLKKVMLSTSGLAFFEHQGTLKGQATLNLSARMDQVNDMLKSLVVYDQAGGTLGGISLPGQMPLQQAFRDLPFTPDDLRAPHRLLNALKGADVQLHGPANAKGMIVAAHPTPQKNHKGQRTAATYSLTLLSDAGLQTFTLDSLSMVTFTDPALHQQIQKALKALLTHKAADSRTIAIDLSGPENRERTVKLAYVVEAPVWKSAYRISLPYAGEETPKTGLLQGWAIIENTTGQDWNNIQLSLTSGQPVTYWQALYNPYFLSRPELPVQVANQVLPRLDQGEFITEDAALAPQMDMAENAGATFMANGDIQEKAARTLPMRKSITATALGALARPRTQAAAIEKTTQVEYTFQTPFTVKAGYSLMVPVVNQNIPMEQIWLYQPDTNAQHPLATLQIKNTGSSGLPPGIITLYEQDAQNDASFVGDAQMPVLGKGEERLISYALDTKTDIRTASGTDRTIQKATVSNGHLTFQTRYINTTTYTIQAPPHEERTVILEHPRRNQWTIAPIADAEITETRDHYRIKVHIAKGKTRTVKVTTQRPGSERHFIGTLPEETLLQYVGQLQDLSPDAAAALQQVIALKAETSKTQTALNRLTQQVNDQIKTQDRIRKNLQAVPARSDVHNKYLEKLDRVEDHLSRLYAEKSKLDDKLNEQQAKLATYIQNMKF